MSDNPSSDYMSEDPGVPSTPEESVSAEASSQEAKAEMDLTPAEPRPTESESVPADPWHQMSDAEMMAMAEKERPAPVTKHVWTSEDTYASLAQKFYGSFQEPYWRLIYEYNKAIIGNHPNAIREGLEIEIPPLPDELKR